MKLQFILFNILFVIFLFCYILIFGSEFLNIQNFKNGFVLDSINIKRYYFFIMSVKFLDLENMK